MVHFSLLHIKAFRLYVIWEKKSNLGIIFFASPKICTPVHLWVSSNDFGSSLHVILCSMLLLYFLVRFLYVYGVFLFSVFV